MAYLGLFQGRTLCWFCLASSLRPARLISSGNLNASASPTGVAKAEETCDEMSDFLEVLVDNMFDPGASSASVICTPTSFREVVYD